MLMWQLLWPIKLFINFCRKQLFNGGVYHKGVVLSNSSFLYSFWWLMIFFEFHRVNINTASFTIWLYSIQYVHMYVFELFHDKPNNFIVFSKNVTSCKTLQKNTTHVNLASIFLHYLQIQKNQNLMVILIISLCFYTKWKHWTLFLSRSDLLLPLMQGQTSQSANTQYQVDPIYPYILSI